MGTNSYKGAISSKFIDNFSRVNEEFVTVKVGVNFRLIFGTRKMKDDTHSKI